MIILGEGQGGTPGSANYHIRSVATTQSAVRWHGLMFEHCGHHDQTTAMTAGWSDGGFD